MSKKKASSKAKSQDKNTPKATVVKAEKAVETTKENVAKKAESGKSFSFKIDKGILKPILSILVLLLVLLAVDFYVQYLNNYASIAVVNGKRISKSEYYDKLDELYGDQVAEMLIEEELVKQIALEENIAVENADIDERYDEIAEEVGGMEALDEMLVMYEMDKAELRDQLKNEILLEKIIAPTLEYSDDDLEQFFNENKEFIYPDAEDKAFEEEKDSIEDIYVQNKVFEQRDVILKEYRDKFAVQVNTPKMLEEEGRGYGIFQATRNIISNLMENDEE